MTTPIGDSTYLSSYLVNTKVYGVVVPEGDPPEFWATYEIAGDNGTLFMAAVLGPDGLPGRDAFALRLQTDSINDTADLPQTLTNTEADLGKYWIIDDAAIDGTIIGSSMYVWYGTSWRRLMLGSPGPPGPVPIITPSVELIPSNQSSAVIKTGTAHYPNWHLKLAVPPGPTGPSASLASCPDVDFTTSAPQAGDVLAYSAARSKWVPMSISQLTPRIYSVPEASFSDTGLQGGQALQIGTFAVPPQPFDWTPIVWGHLPSVEATDLTNLQFFRIGAEVLLGNPTTGTRVARGFGQAFQDISIMPHWSRTNSNTGAAVSPTNSYARVPANHVDPALGTLYINLADDGNFILGNFHRANAQLFVLVMPLGSTTPLDPNPR